MNLSLSDARDIGLPFHLHEPTETTRVTLPLDARNMAEFDALLHEVNPEAPRADINRVQRLANWLASQPEATVEALIDARLCRAADLRRMLDDTQWPVEPGLRARAERMLGYVEHGGSLIDDARPLLGKLDEALLVDLCWPEFREAVDEFCEYCCDVDEGRTAAPMGLVAWREERRAEEALWRHQQRATWGHYAPVSESPLRFRVD